MTEQGKRARPVRAFLQRLGLQIVISGSAMAAIHFGTGMLPSLGALFGQDQETVATVEQPAAAAPVAVVNEVRAADPASDVGPAEATTQAPPLPEPAPLRPVQATSAVKTAAVRASGVQRFDACDPACPSQDPLLRREERLVASADPAIGGGTEFPERLDDGAEGHSHSLLAMPERALATAGRATEGVWNRVETLLPF